MHNQVIGPLFFVEATIKSDNSLDMLEYVVLPQLAVLQPEFIYQRNGAPQQWSLIVHDFLNEHFDEQWIGHDGQILWPPRSSGITTLHFVDEAM